MFLGTSDKDSEDEEEKKEEEEEEEEEEDEEEDEEEEEEEEEREALPPSPRTKCDRFSLERSRVDVVPLALQDHHIVLHACIHHMGHGGGETKRERED